MTNRQLQNQIKEWVKSTPMEVESAETDDEVKVIQKTPNSELNLTCVTSGTHCKMLFDGEFCASLTWMT